MITLPRRRVWKTMLMCSALVITAAMSTSACTGPRDAGDPLATSTVLPSELQPGPVASPTSQAPVTQPGVATGPGVSNTEIAIGALVDAGGDRGFSSGLSLWASSVNNDGGVCGRKVRIDTGGSDVQAAYLEMGPSVLGFVMSVENESARSSVARTMSADQIPAVAVAGIAVDLFQTSPVVIGPTRDVMAINTLDHLVQAKAVGAAESIGVISDESPAAQDALAGLRWYAASAGIDVIVAATGKTPPPNFPSLPVVFSLAAPATTADLAAALPASTLVVTDVNGYDPTLLSAASAAHLQVMLPTPAYGSDHPGAAAVAKVLLAEGISSPGPMTFSGYAAGAAWQRLLTAACEGSSLTREGIRSAFSTIGPASLESMLGASDPGRVVSANRPATVTSALAQADPTAPSGMTPLTGLISAENIEKYWS
ncbi:hypothetical protein EH165_02800 [Nakamurella antarctica]|uniref:Leucine-binding protein domain-containing protein n=1 Tax=Nakamurella antarctica TaxID=1902245 RepID=A0A3G8ZT64_9ACTN|nr:ABC transporter substrate-binding protein [Nakamurella antarctica]AZI57246.1 hypothetical protein EH165_02800 [Nakamurella antarctica]